MSMFGLLVGINHYLFDYPYRNLRGCVNDVNNLSSTLQDRFDVDPTKQLKILIDSQATRDNIITAFKSFLIKRDWSENDIALFHFSGHGAQSFTHEAFQHIETDNLNESLVCHDSRTQGIPDLLDKELRYLIAQLAKKCRHIVIILDCCHSGHGTRLLEEGNLTARFAVTDTQNYPLSTYVFAENANDVDALSKEQLAALIPASCKHLLISGCQSHELSRESYISPDSTERAGVFTTALCQVLKDTSTSLNYHELYNRTTAKIKQKNFPQNPSFEAIADFPINQEVFGGDLLPLRRNIYQNRDGKWILNAGVIEGFAQGDSIAIFSIDADTVVMSNRMTTATLKTVSNTSSELDIEEENSLTDSEYIAVIIEQAMSAMPVALVGAENGVTALREALKDTTHTVSPGKFLIENEALATYKIVAESANSFYLTQNGDKRPRYKKADSSKAVLTQAATLARWQQKLSIHNPLTQLENDVVNIVITTENNQDYINPKHITLKYTYNEATGKWDQPRFKLRIELKPSYHGRLYCALLFFDGSNGDINNALISGGWLGHHSTGIDGDHVAQAKLLAHESKWIPVKLKKELKAQGIVQTTDHLKIILSEEKFNSHLLVQGGLSFYEEPPTTKGTDKKRGLSNILDKQFGKAHTRSFGEEDEVSQLPDWTTIAIPLTINCPTSFSSIPNEQHTNKSLGTKTKIIAHPNLKGSVCLTSSILNQDNKQQHNTFIDTLASDTVFTFNDGFNMDTGLDVLELRLNDNTRSLNKDESQLSTQHPLIIETEKTLGSNEYLIPVVYDAKNELYLPVGYAKSTESGTRIAIEQLPDSAFEKPDAETRSLGSALKIYFKKLIYRDLLNVDQAIHWLRIPEFSAENPREVTGYLNDEDIIKKHVENANSILILVHGIIGHTDSMAGFVNLKDDKNQSLAEYYDLVLTFDYENLNTNIRETAKAFKSCLDKIGINNETGAQVDVIAHSMGGLVSRYFIEYEGGQNVINRLIMVGTPNNGSPLAGLGEKGESAFRAWAYTNLTAALNGYLGAGIAGSLMIKSLVTFLEKTTVTLDQMIPDSDFLQSLQVSNKPENTQYVLIAGDTSGILTSLDSEHSGLKRFLKAIKGQVKIAGYGLLTKHLFANEVNDLAVSHRSMTTFNPEWGNFVEIHTVNSDHLSYFNNEQTIDLIANINLMKND